MQPVKTTALRANEAARNLNAGNNGEVEDFKRCLGGQQFGQRTLRGFFDRAPA